MKKFLSILLLISMFLSLPPGISAQADVSDFPLQRLYRNNLFQDVNDESWYAESVQTVYELGLMDGVDHDSFAPDEAVTMTLILTAAARLHRIYTSGKDDFKPGRVAYDVYVRYCLEQGIIDSRFGCKKVATRAQVVDVLSRALPEEELAAQNEVQEGRIPDVAMEDPYAHSIYAMYRAGIVSGSDSQGSFYPEGTVSRAEAAVLLCRMVDPAQRKLFRMVFPGPEVDEKERQDDSFFKQTAFFGNSLVDGLRLYAKFRTVDYFCASSVTVYSSMNDKTWKLSDGSQGTMVEALAREQYDKIYIHLGINEIRREPEYFRTQFTQLLQQISAIQPWADIYLMSILPVTQEKDEGGVFTIARVQAYNEVLLSLAEEWKCYYLDVYSLYVDEDGYLPKAWSPDGVHLYEEKYSIWEEHIRSHYA